MLVGRKDGLEITYEINVRSNQTLNLGRFRRTFREESGDDTDR